MEEDATSNNRERGQNTGNHQESQGKKVHSATRIPPGMRHSQVWSMLFEYSWGVSMTSTTSAAGGSSAVGSCLRGKPGEGVRARKYM